MSDDNTSTNQITWEHRFNIIQTMRRDEISWCGDLDDITFLSRIYDLDLIEPLNSGSNTKSEIWNNRVGSSDWPIDWIFDDSRFDLMHCADVDFIKFLCETIHPTVRKNDAECQKLLKLYNAEIRSAGFEIIRSKSRLGNMEYSTHKPLEDIVVPLDDIMRTDPFNTEYVNNQITKMKNNLEHDPELAIGTAKEFVETVSKTILEKLNRDVSSHAKLPDLVKQVINESEPFGSLDTRNTTDTIRKAVNALSTLIHCISELRNVEGTGHGRKANSTLTKPEHAKLAVNLATALGLFLIDTFNDSSKNG